MIKDAEEFYRLRNSELPEEYNRAANESAELETWLDVIEKYPDMKVWTIHNKTIQIEILEKLVKDADPDVRSAIARKRKITDKIIRLLSNDTDENVKYSLICNTKIGLEHLKNISTDGSDWFKNELQKKINEKNLNE